MSQRLRIGELAKSVGTSTKTLRFYENAGLLRQPERSDAGYRLYDDHAVRRAKLVVGLRRLGLTIEEIKQLLDESNQRSRRQRLLALMDEKVSELDLNLSVLQGRRDDLAARQQALSITPRDRPAECVCDALLEPCSCDQI